MTSTFQTIVLIVFGGAIVIAVLVFSGIIPGYGLSRSSVAETILIWGTLPEEAMSRIIQPLNIQYRNQIVFEYQEKLPVNFENELVQALASGVGPDIVMMSSSLLQKHKSKLVPLTEELWPVRDFRDTFVTGSEVLIDQSGIWGIPLLTNPMVLYTNRSLLASAGVSEPPKTWAELLVQAPKVTMVTDKGDITKSYVALGRSSNVTNLKDILAAMFFQLGNPMISQDSSGRWVPTIDRTVGGTNSAPATALIYFLQFADPAKTVYSWNSALPEDRQAFAAGTLALYFGLAGDLGVIQQLNPNLDFDVAVIPQRDLANQMTSGRILMAAVTKKGTERLNVLKVLQILSDKTTVEQLVANNGLPPARRDILAAEVGDPYLAVFYRSALIMKDWLDPDPALTTDIFNQLVQTTGSGRSIPNDALSSANNQILNLTSTNI